jgi:hypothetical protein
MPRASRIPMSWLVALVVVAAAAGGAASGPAGTALAQSQGILIAGGGPTTPVQLGRGCNQVIADAPNGARVAALVSLVSPSDAVISVWRFKNATKLYQDGYFADQSAPTDFVALGGTSSGRTTDAYMVCVSKSALIIAS